MEKVEKSEARVDAGEVKEVAQALAAPFEEAEVKWKAQVVSGNRAMVVAYVNARVIQDRLDEVLGVMGWQDSYECLPDGAVVCRLRIRLGDEWITKMDVGGQSEQPDEGDRRKAAFSDALKRAAVKFGIGRYLYGLEPQWVDYDPQKKKLLGTPKLPAGALPAAKPLRKPEAQAREPLTAAAPPAPAEGKRKEKPATVKMAPPPAPAQPADGPREAKGGKPVPANGAELRKRLYDYDERLARQGLCQQGDLVKHVVAAGVAAGYERELDTWSGPAILLAVEETRAFEAGLRKPEGKGAKKEVA
jgi:hypothetical protein